ncbi:MAG TPA: hypothetical protein VGH42_01595 [Verrucomicrobiae bacterium]|jgi:hypothetical protein
MTLQEAERITSWYRRQFSDPGTDIEFVSRCHKVLKGGLFSMNILALSPLIGLYRGKCSLKTAIILIIVCYVFALLFLVCTRQLARVRAFLETNGHQNLSDVSNKFPSDRNA